MLYDTSLLAGADLVNESGIPHLANLAAGDSDLDLDAFALRAHRWVYRRLEERGIQPGQLTNETRLEAAVAYAAVVRLVRAGELEELDADAWLADAEREVDRFRPVYPPSSNLDEPSAAGQAMPRLANVRRVGFFDTGVAGEFYDDTPRRL